MGFLKNQKILETIKEVKKPAIEDFAIAYRNKEGLIL